MPARRAPARGGTVHVAADLASLLRIHTAGFEALVFVLGPLIGGWRGKAGEFVALWSIGIIVNSYIFVLDDLVDLPHDRANPKRSRRPLVGGRVSVRVALGLSISFPLAALMIAAISGWPHQAEVPFAAVLIAAAFVNIYHQVTRRPLLMDLLYATAMASPIPICSLAVLHGLTLLTWSATAALFLLALQLNSIAGNLKDLEPDRRTGLRTVALAFGAVLAPDGTLRPGSRYRRYCWVLQSLTWLTLALALAEAVRAPAAWEIAAIALAALIAFAVGTRDLARLLSGARQPSQTGRELYFAAEFAVLLLAVAVHSHLVPFLAALGLLAIWTSGFGIYGQSHRPADSTDGPVLEQQELQSVTVSLPDRIAGTTLRRARCLYL
jgi:4-hydroxybenzoate polyprenyltransferase